MELCAENIIKPVHWPFYESLMTSNSSKSETESEDEEF